MSQKSSNFRRLSIALMLSTGTALSAWAAAPASDKHIDEAIFKGPLPPEMVLKLSKPARKGSCSVEETTTRRQKEGIACEDHFTESVTYLGVTFDSLIFTVSEAKRLRTTLAFNSEGPCSRIFKTFTYLAMQLQKAKHAPKMQATKAFVMGDLLTIPSEEIGGPGIESNSAVYFSRPDRAGADGVCRIDLQINPPSPPKK